MQLRIRIKLLEKLDCQDLMMIVRSISHMNRTNSESDCRISLFVMSQSCTILLSMICSPELLQNRKVPVILDLVTQSSTQDYVCLKITSRYLKLIVEEVL